MATAIQTKTRAASHHETVRWHALLRYGAIFFLSSWVAFYLARGLSAAWWFDGAPGDGPFQMLNPLRRIAAGQTPGRDFVFYHGIGLPYLYYPMFALFGKTLAASELSRQWTTLLLFFGTALFFVRTLLAKSRWWPVALATIIIALEVAFPLAPTPGLSQVASRSAMPLVVFGILLLPVRPLTRAILSGTVIGIAWTCGTEHGISLTLAFAIIGVLGIVRSEPGRNAKLLTVALGMAALTAAAAFLVLGGWDGAGKALRYALVELPSDKFWFDGAPPNPYLGTWSDLVSSRHFILPLLPTMVAIVLLGFAIRWFWRSRSSVFNSVEGVMCLMLVYGILSGIPLLGVFSKHYVLPLVRVLAFVALMLVVRCAANYRRHLELPSAISTRGSWIAAAAFVVIGLFLLQATAVRGIALTRHLTRDPFTYSKKLDASWDSFMTQATTSLGPQIPALWSVYSGLLEEHYGIFVPAEDYMTLAAGADRRRRYVGLFRNRQPRTVQTMSRDFSYEEWLQNVRWEFYEDLVNNYQVTERIGHSLFWTRKAAPWQAPSNDFDKIEVDAGGTARLSSDSGERDALGVVRLTYRAHNPWSRIPLFGMTPRYMVEIEGSPRHCMVSLPPYESVFQFPVQIPAGQTMTLRFDTRSLLPNVQLQVTMLELKRLPYEPSHEALLLPKK